MTIKKVVLEIGFSRQQLYKLANLYSLKEKNY